jgi:hypothetical protein
MPQIVFPFRTSMLASVVLLASATLLPAAPPTSQPASQVTPKMYTNSTYHFGMEFPSNWKVKDEHAGARFYHLELLPPPTVTAEGRGDPRVEILVKPEVDPRVRNWKEANERNNAEVKKANPQNSVTAADHPVAGAIGYEFLVKAVQEDGSMLCHWHVSFEKVPYTYLIDIWSDSENYDAIKSAVDKGLAGFKFVQ